MAEQKIQIMGAGAIGCLFGAMVQLAGYDVVFVGRGEQLKALQNTGLQITGLINTKLEVVATDKPVDADITIVSVKSYDTENAARLLSRVDCGITFTIQNGIGNLEILSMYLDTVVGGVTTYGANLVKPGTVNFAGEGITYAGNDGFVSREAEAVVKVLVDSGMNCQAVDDISSRIWSKAIVNAAINPLTAICRVRNGSVVEINELWEIAEAIIEEGENLMKKMGIRISQNLRDLVREVAIKTAKNKSSMLQDIERGRRTEVDFINGKIAELAEKHGVDARVNRLIANLVKGVEKSHGFI